MALGIILRNILKHRQKRGIDKEVRDDSAREIFDPMAWMCKSGLQISQLFAESVAFLDEVAGQTEA